MGKSVKMYTYSGKEKQDKIDVIVHCGMPEGTEVHVYSIEQGYFAKLTEADTINTIRSVRNNDNYVLVFVQQEEKNRG